MVKKIIMWGVFIVIIVLIVAYFWRNWLVKKAVEAGGEYALGVETVLGSAEVSLRGGELELNHLDFRNPKGFEGGDLLDINFGQVVVDIGSIFGQEVDIDTLLLDEIKINFDQVDNKGNFMIVLNHIKSLDLGSSDEKSKKIKVKYISVRNLSVDGSLTVMGKEQYKKSFAVPDFTMRDIGGKSGAPLAQIMAIVVKEIIARAAAVGSGQLSGKLGDSLNEAKNNIVKQAESEVKSKIENLGKKLIGGGNK
jgi:hypothetical protein